MTTISISQLKFKFKDDAKKQFVFPEETFSKIENIINNNTRYKILLLQGNGLVNDTFDDVREYYYVRLYDFEVV